MTVRTTLFAAAALLALTASAAEAARLVTPAAYVGDGDVQCRLAYFGFKRDLPVKVEIVLYASNPSPDVIRKSFKMGPNNRAISAGTKGCNPGVGNAGCHDAQCVFTVNETASLFLGGACGDAVRSNTRCIPAK